MSDIAKTTLEEERFAVGTSILMVATLTFGVVAPPPITPPPVTPPVTRPLAINQAAALRLGDHELDVKPPKKDDQWLAVTTGWHSKFVSPFGRVCFDHPVWQTSATIFAPSIDGIPGKFFANLWHSASFKGGGLDDDSGDELDYTLGWAGPIGDDSLIIGKTKASVWLTYFDYVGMGNLGGCDELRLGAKVWQEIPLGRDHVVKPFWWTWIPLASEDGKTEGLWNFAGIEHTWHFFEDMGLRQKACLILDDGTKGFSPSVLGEYKVGLFVEPRSGLSIELGYIRVIGPFGHPRDGRETEVVFGFGFTLKL